MTPPASPPVEPIKPESETESDSNEKEASVQKNRNRKNCFGHEKFDLVQKMKNLRQFFKALCFHSTNEKVDTILIYDINS